MPLPHLLFSLVERQTPFVGVWRVFIQVMFIIWAHSLIFSVSQIIGCFAESHRLCVSDIVAFSVPRRNKRVTLYTVIMQVPHIVIYLSP